MYPDCLKELVGIGQIGCGDYDPTKDKSTLGLFLTEDPAYNYCKFVGGDAACDLTKLFIQKREEAYRQVTTDISAVLASKITTRSESEYQIGGWDRTGRYLGAFETPVTPSIKIKTEQRDGAFIRIDRITLTIAPVNGVAVDVDIRVKRESDGQVLKTYTLTYAVISVMPRKVEPLKIPCDGETYIVEYDFDSTKFFVQVGNYHCGCGDKLKNAKGFLCEQMPATGRVVLDYGIQLFVAVGCDAGLKICSLLKNPDYKAVIGNMIRKKTIELTVQHLFFTQEVNRFTLLSPEDIGAQIQTYAAEYSERLRWFSVQNQFEVDGFCLQCSGGGIRKVSLLTGR